jgi:uncharacterized protein (DUF1778 family)
MTDVLIRGISDEDLARLDRAAERQGLARAEFVRRAVVQEARRVTGSVTMAEWREFADLVADVTSEDFEARAWGHGE